MVILNFLWIDGVPCLLPASFLFSFLHTVLLADKTISGSHKYPRRKLRLSLTRKRELAGIGALTGAQCGNTEAGKNKSKTRSQGTLV